MFKLLKRIKKLEEDNIKLVAKIMALEEKVCKKTISDKTLQEDEPVPYAQIIDEWINGEADGK